MKKYHYLEFNITEKQENTEILSILRQEMRLSTRKIRALKRHPEGILLDEVPVTVRETVRSGQKVKVILNDTEEGNERVLPAPMALSILYEDENLLFVNKPAGIVCHPSQGHLTDSLASGVAAYFLEQEELSQVHLIGRLDKDTSGILGIAKNKVTAERMIALREQGKVQKEYLALVNGCPPKEEGAIEIGMKEYRNRESGDGRLRMCRDISSSGKHAMTHYQVIQRLSGYTLCHVHIETGRTHQIRFHMAQIGCPLMGDDLYGSSMKQSEKAIDRTALHAYRSCFSHPFTGEKVELTAPLPDDMKKML